MPGPGRGIDPALRETGGCDQCGRRGGLTAGHSGGMTAGDSGGRSPAAGRRQWHARRTAVAALAAAAIIAGLVLGRHTLAESLQKLAGLDWTWFLLAIICEFVSLTATDVQLAGLGRVLPSDMGATREAS